MTPNEIATRVLHEVPMADPGDLMYLVNRELKRLASKRRWRYYQTSYMFNVVEQYSTGTVDVTEGDATVTGTGTTFTSAMVGRKFSVDGEAGIYTIASFTSATEIELDRVWARDTLSAQTYLIWQDTFALPADVHNILTLRNLATGHELYCVSNLERLQEWQPFGVTGFYRPDYYSVWGKDSNGQLQIVLRGAPNNTDPMELHYYRLPATQTGFHTDVDCAGYMEEAVYQGVLGRVLVRHPESAPLIQLAQQDYVEAVKDAAKIDQKIATPVLRNKPNRAFM